MIKRLGHHIVQHVVPTKHNGFIPRLLREKQIFAMLGVGLALLVFAQYVRLTDHFGLTAEVYPATIITLTNKDRSANGLSEVTVNEKLTNAAKLKAEDMAKKGYFAHTSPEGRTPWYWFGQAGYSFLYAGENLAINFEESDAVETAWLNSPTHRANIMNKNFTEMGVATATGFYNGKKTTFVVEMFGMPAAVRTPITPTAKPAPLPSTAPAPSSTPKPITAVAGESAEKIAVLEETPTYTIAQNLAPNLEPADPVPAPMPKISWVKRLMLQSDRLAGMVIEIILILAIISTAGMVAREYEKRHRIHMVYGTLVAIIMFTSLFVGRLGFFTPKAPIASAPVLDAATLR
jgi:hypothetical protein